MANYVVSQYMQKLTSKLAVTAGMIAGECYNDEAKAEMLAILGGDPNKTIIPKGFKLYLENGLTRKDKDHKFTLSLTTFAAHLNAEYTYESKYTPYVYLLSEWFDIEWPSREEIVELAWGAVMQRLETGNCEWANVSADPVGTISVTSHCEIYRSGLGTVPMWTVNFFFPGHSPASVVYHSDPAVRR